MTKLAKFVQQQLKHDAPYAWFLRDQASTSPIFKCSHLTELDNRLESYLSCFWVSKTEQYLLLSKLNKTDWGAVYIIASVALRSNNGAVFDEAVTALTELQQAKELGDAFSKIEYELAKPFLQKLLKHDNPLARVAAISVYGYYEVDIENTVFIKLLNDKPIVIIAALKMICKNKLFNYKDSVDRLLSHGDESVAFQAVYTGSLLAMPTAIALLKDHCFKETVFLKTALSLLYQVINESEIVHVVNRIQKSSVSPRIKAYNIAQAGLTDKIPLLIEWMNDPEYAPIAGEAFSFITGVDIEEDDLSLLNVELCESREAPLAEKRRNDRWTEAYEDDLPWPDSERVSNWWGIHKHQFETGTRYLAGKTLTKDNMKIVLKKGTQTQRHSASLFLAVRNPYEKIVNITLN
ncbi:MAG: hypothetical protein ACC657_16055 [Thiohalomonadales bacterium]